MEYNIKTRNYLMCDELKKITLEALYSYNSDAIAILDYNLSAIVNTEAPLTLNTLKHRIREAFGVAKISQKALDIINDRMNKLGFVRTNNLFDEVIWTDEGVYNVEYLRINCSRQIYDIPYQELNILTKYLINKGLSKEELYREILAYFGYEVLTKKASDYLSFIEEMANKC